MCEEVENFEEGSRVVMKHAKMGTKQYIIGTVSDVKDAGATVEWDNNLTTTVPKHAIKIVEVE